MSGEGSQRGVYTGLSRASIAARAFAAMADNVRDFAIILLNPHGIITFWGEGARLMKWWTKDQTEGSHIRMLYPDGGSTDGTAEAHLRVAAERGEYSGEGARMRADGSTFWAGVTLTALRDQHGTLLGFAKTTRDLSARRAADAQLKAAAESAEHARATAVAADALKSGFLATISHEIRTPVNAILGYHQLLQMEIDGPLSEGQHNHLRRASASGQHLLSLITDVLDFSRIDAGHASVKTGAFSLGSAIASALDVVAPQATERGVDIRNSVSGLAQQILVAGDEASTRQVLTNLLVNSVKFTPARERDRPVTISAGTAVDASPEAQLTGDGPWVYIRVEDCGSGIAPEQLESMFDPFVQGDMSLTRQPGGTGLGLAISRRLARLMGGDVTAKSELGVGSTFVLWLPASLASAPRAPTEPLRFNRRRDDRTWAPSADVPPPVAALSRAIVLDMEQVMRAYVARLREDGSFPISKAVSQEQLENHVGTFLADLARALIATPPDAEKAEEVGMEEAASQLVVARRHGAERARLGWSADEIHREFGILREELLAAVHRRLPAFYDPLAPPAPDSEQLPNPRSPGRVIGSIGTGTSTDDAAHDAASATGDLSIGLAERDALELLDRFLALSEQVSVDAHADAMRAVSKRRT